MRQLHSLLLVIVLFILACNSPFVVKQKGYPAIQFPSKQYIVFNDSKYPYSFEYPTYAKIDNQVQYFGVSKQNDAWLNIRFPQFGGTLYVSYSKIGNPRNHAIDTLIRDAYKFANNHNNKASFIEDSVFTTSQGVHGVFFHIGGNVATSYQFFFNGFHASFF